MPEPETPSPRQADRTTAPGGDEPFYIGYDPPMPGAIARVVRRAVAGLVGLGLTGVALIALRHRAIDGGVFEFGTVRPVAGVVVERPYPALRIAGRSASTLLVGTGKHGASPLVRGLTDRAVIVQGQRISRDGNEMLEIADLTVSRTPDVSPGAPPDLSSGAASGALVTLRGEIVDSKCFLGVMTPGQGKTHRACASLCLRGGIPPALFVADRAGASRLVLLVSPAGTPLDPAIVADRAFEPTEMGGTLSRVDGWWVLQTDPATWRRVD